MESHLINVSERKTTLTAQSLQLTLTNHVKHEVSYQEAQCHCTAKYERSS